MHPPQDASRFEAANRIIAQSKKEEEARKAAALKAQERARQMPPPDGAPRRLAPSQLSFPTPPASPMNTEVAVVQRAGADDAAPPSQQAETADAETAEAETAVAETAVAETADSAEARRRKKATVIDEDPAYLYVYYPSDTARDDRIVLNEGMILKELNTTCMMAGMPNIAERTITIRLETMTGPASIFGFNAKECTTIIGENPVLVVDGKTKDGTASQGILEVNTWLIDVRAELGLDKSEGMGEEGISYMATYNRTPVNHIRKFGGWIEISLTEAQIGLGVNINDAKDAIRNLPGIKYFRPRHVQAKTEDDEEDGKLLPMGEKILTHRYNFTVKPREGDMKSYDWASFPTIPCEKLVLYKDEVKAVPIELHYSVGGDSLIDRARTELTGRVQYLICNKKYGCKRPNLLCLCRKGAANHREFKRARAATANPTEARKMLKAEGERKYNERVRVAQKATFGPTPEPETQRACPYALVKAPDGRLQGKCVRGKRCSLNHEVFAKERIDPATVECHCSKSKNGTCAAGKFCIYKHDCKLKACAPKRDEVTTPNSQQLKHRDNPTPSFTYTPPAVGPPPKPG